MPNFENFTRKLPNLENYRKITSIGKFQEKMTIFRKLHPGKITRKLQIRYLNETTEVFDIFVVVPL